MSKLHNIYMKYFKDPAVVVLPPGLITNELVEELTKLFGGDKSHEKMPTITTTFSVSGSDSKFHTADSSKVKRDLLDDLMKKCLKELYDKAFVEYKKTSGYTYQMRNLNHQYNQVSVDDFDYMEALGSGGYGFVVHCRKKSTGKHYAMSKCRVTVGSVV